MNKICRICLEEGVLTSIFSLNYNVTLCEMIEYSTNTKVIKGEGLPEQLCSNCVYKLGIAYIFKQTCESADVRLRQHLALPGPSSKTNDVAIMTDPAPPQTIFVKQCIKCQPKNKKRTNYRRKPEGEKLKRGPKPKNKPAVTCPQCDKEFRGQAQLDTHIRTHTGERPFSCDFCQRQFAQKHNLTIHMRTHTGDKPFQCDICSKSFSAQGNLVTHLKIHAGQKDHSCRVCEKAFVTSSELTRHMNKHRGVKDHKCHCGASFLQVRDLRLHKMRKHQVPATSETKDSLLNTHIDIIGLDIEKDTNASLALKETLGPELKVTEEKDLYSPYALSQERHNCTICGEQFEYISVLAQHYLHSHKEHESMSMNRFSLQ